MLVGDEFEEKLLQWLLVLSGQVVRDKSNQRSQINVSVLFNNVSCGVMRVVLELPPVARESWKLNWVL
jgi:hypothetical protein